MADLNITFYTTEIFKSQLLQGAIALNTDTIKAILLDASTSAIAANDLYRTYQKYIELIPGSNPNALEYLEFSAVGTNYTSGGAELSNKTLTAVVSAPTAPTTYKLTADSVVWPSLSTNGTSGIAGMAIIDMTSDTIGDVLAIGLFDSVLEFASSNLTINWPSTGIITI